MKLTLNVDCTPDEARAFFGLPNVAPVNDMIVSAMVERTKENLDSLADPSAFWDRAMTASGAGMDVMAKMFAASMGGGQSPGDKKK